MALLAGLFGLLVTNSIWILLISVVLTVVYLIKRQMNAKPPGRNPFAEDHRRPKEKMVVDKDVRAAVLKQKFDPKGVPRDNDVVVIGSGAGGLATGVILARAGLKVLVLEKNGKAGGCCHTFVKKGSEFDTGIHYIGNMGSGLTRHLLDQLTAGQLEWATMDDQFDEVALGDPENARRFGMRSGRKAYFDNLKSHFPGEETAIDKYEQLVSAANRAFSGVLILKMIPMWAIRVLAATGLHHLLFKCFKFTSKTLQEELDAITDNKDLKAVLSYICGNYGVFPNEVPFLLHAMHIRHYCGGAFYPVGGPSEIAFQMVKAIEAHGGKVLMRAPVTHILCDQAGKAIGVRVSHASGDVDIAAKQVVSDAGVANTFNRLLPPDVAKRSFVYPTLKAVGPSLSFLTLFAGLDGTQEELKLPSGNTWSYAKNDLNAVLGDYVKLAQEDIGGANVPLCYISFPSAKDPTSQARHPGRSSVLVITLAKWEWFKAWDEERLRHRGEDYEQLKNSIGESMWRSACSLFPQIDGKRDYMEVGTPVTNKHYLGGPQGEMYGLNQGKERFTLEALANLRPETDIPGLFLTGQDVLLCGFASVLYAGVMTSAAMLRRNLLTDLNAQRAALRSDKKRE